MKRVEPMTSMLLTQCTASRPHLHHMKFYSVINIYPYFKFMLQIKNNNWTPKFGRPGSVALFAPPRVRPCISQPVVFPQFLLPPPLETLKPSPLSPALKSLDLVNSLVNKVASSSTKVTMSYLA